ncbi:MAG: hypothetical protein GY842_27710 [bacterium]|nr:hypothetical protein [bacterium]
MTTDTETRSDPSRLDHFSAQLRGELGHAFNPTETKWVAHAPRTLDCMGGFAEYCGALTLTLPTADAVYVAAQPRQDQNVQISLATYEGNGHHTACTVPLALWYADGQLADAAQFARRFKELDAEWAAPVIGVLHALLARGHAQHFGGGLSLAVLTVPDLSPHPADAATTSAATMAAAAPCLGLEIPPVELAALVQHSQNHVMGLPCGPSAAACALLGQARTMLQLLCQPFEVLGGLRVPEGQTILGIDSGARHPAAVLKFHEARVAAFMGRRIIERLFDARNRSTQWGGYLAQLSVSDYVDTLRDRLPTKMKGRDFVDRFGDTDDPLTTLDPDGIYKIRSRAEHHIYENSRVHQFAERIARVQRTGQQNPLIEAGELMYASHWSYGQRCGLGSLETDKLVNCLRECGIEAGIYGAKVCGAGAGGNVVVLMADSPSTRQALQDALSKYHRLSGCSPRLLPEPSDGAATFAVQRLP